MAGLLLTVAATLPFQSCIGSFGLTNRVLSWNNQVGSKFLNELVFFAFWVLPVYEVTGIADLLILNSIEFWSGSNPVEARNKTIKTEQGNYYVACNEKGYEILAPTGEKYRLEYESESETWSVAHGDEEAVPFMTMVDDSHVKMIIPEGDFRMVELTQEGVLAYAKATGIGKMNSTLCLR